MRSECLGVHGLGVPRRLRSLAVAFALGLTLGVPGRGAELPSPVFLHPDLVTYWGAGGDDWITDVSVDAADGEQVITMVGITSPGAFSFLGENLEPGQADAFVTRLRPDGQVLWSTLLAGPGVDGALSLDVDADGRVAVIGWASPGFPTSPGALRSAGAGLDAFVSLVSQTGAVLYTATLGGAGEDAAAAVAFDADGAIVLSGYTGSADLPTTPGALQASHGGGAYDAFVARIRPDATLPAGQQLLYATYLGGSANEAWCCRFMDRNLNQSRLAILSPGLALVVGGTMSGDFPQTEPPIGTAGMGNDDVFVVVLDLNPAVPPDEQVRLSFLLGGSGAESANSLVVEDAQTLVIGGSTLSWDFPATPGAVRGFHPAAGQEWDLFVVRLSIEEGLAPEDRLLYGTYLGGDANDLVFSMAQADPGTVLLAGMTFSANFLDRGGPRTLTGTSDGFLAALVLDSTLPVEDQLVLYEPFGGGGIDQLAGVSLFTSGESLRLVTVGVTSAPDLPVTPGAPGVTRRGTFDGCLGVYTLGSEPLPCPDAPSNLEPADGSLVLGPVVLSWQAGASAQAHPEVYDVYVGRSEEEPALVARGIVGTERVLSGPLDPDAEYSWKVHARNSNADCSSEGSPGISGPTWTFLTPPPCPAAPEDPSPADGSTLASTSAVLSWLASAGAEAYDVYLQKAGETPVLVEEGISETQLAVDGLAPGSAYQWSVCSRNRNATCETSGRPGIEGGPWGFRTPASAPTFLRSDANSTGSTDISDPIGVLGYLFLGGEAPTCLDAADSDDSGDVEITDAIHTLTYLFLGGEPPPAPGPEVCGPDADLESPDLGCEEGCR